MAFKIDSNIKSQDLKTTRFGDFLGMDCFNNPINVNVKRSPKMKNFEYRDGTNRKRYGFIQKGRIFDSSDEEQEINGFWEFTDSIDKLKHSICYAGNKIYRLSFSEETGILSSKTDLNYLIDSVEHIDTSTILNEKSYGIVRGNALYIFTGGNYLIYHKTGNTQNGGLSNWTLEEVADIAYTPTTTIGISTLNSSTNTQALLEDVNILQQFRYNTLIGTKGNLYENLLTAESDISYNFAGESSNDFFNFPMRYKFSNSVIGKLKSLRIVVNNSEEAEVLFFDLPIIDYLDNNNEFVAKYDGRDLESGVRTEVFKINGDIVPQVDTNITQIGFSDKNYLYNTFHTFMLDIHYYLETNELNIDLKVDKYPANTNTSITFKYISSGDCIYQLDSTNIDTTTVEVINTDLIDESNNITGVLESGTDYTISNDGKLTLLSNQEPLIDGQANILVKFKPNKTNNEWAEIQSKITHCTFGTMFGYNEEQQLFVSGNPDYPNYDWHTSTRAITREDYDLTEYEDLTYFSDLSYSKVGNPNNSVTGYTLLNDNNLAIHKSENPFESSLWIRNSYLESKKDINGNYILDNNGNTYQGVQYSMVSSANGEGCLNHNCCKNLNGDKLFLSPSGLYSIILDSNIKSNERYATLRSKLINNQLLKEDLNEATSLVWKGKYYLAINNHIYVCDSNFLYENGDYEWWYFELDEEININLLFIKNNKLWIGAKNGAMLSIGNDEYDENGNLNNFYSDIMFERVSATVLLDEEEISSQKIVFGLTTYNNFDYVNIIDDDNSNYVYQKLATITYQNYIESEIIFSNDDYNNQIFYNHSATVKLFYDGELKQDNYYLRESNSNAGRFILFKMIGDNLEPFIATEDVGEVIIYKKLDGKYNIEYVEGEEQTFRLLTPNGNSYIDIYTESNASLSMIAYKIKPVVAVWWTPVIDLGSALYSKKVTNLTVVPNAYGDGEVKFGYITRKDYSIFQTQGINIFDLSTFDLRYFSLDPNNFSKAYNKKLNISDVNFIQFVITSDNDRECSVNEFMITYFYVKKNKGVR